MSFSHFFRRQLVWLNVPSVLLITLLQRTPILRLASVTSTLPSASPLGALLRSTFTSAVALGAVHALSGATQLATTSPSPLTTTIGASLTVGFAIVGTTSGADSWTFSGEVPPGLTFSGLSSETLLLTGKPTASGTFIFNVQAHDAIGGDTQNYPFTIVVAGNPTAAPAITAQPINVTVTVGGTANFSATVTGSPAPTFQWFRNGRAVAGATSATLSLANVQPSAAGVYTLAATNSAGTAASGGSILGVSTTELFVGSGFSDPAWRSLQHPNGNIYTQILLTGASATVTADPGKVTRISYIDLQDDIVQLEFSGAGSMTVTLDNPSGPALPSKYNQTVDYMRGHASIVIQGAGPNTFFSAFSVGSLTSGNAALFKTGVSYDGHADLARLVIQSPTNQFGGLFMGNTGFNDATGDTGIYAPGVLVVNNIRIHDITAFDSARPVMIFGSTPNPDNGLRILGGNLDQPNGKAIEISGVNKVIMGPGTDSHNRSEAAQTNKGRLESNGINVTATLVVNPAP